MTKNQKANLALGTIVVTICLFAALYLWPSFEGPMNVSPPTEPGTQAHTPSSSRSGEPAHTFDELLDAIEWVESKGDANAVGDGGDAVGAYQIHKIYVDDVNRIVKNQYKDRHEIAPQYTYEDRLDKTKSREMVKRYFWNYAPDHRQSQLTDGGIYIDDSDHTDMYYFGTCARIHNRGPQGHKKESTKAYWLKVKSRMESVK